VSLYVHCDVSARSWKPSCSHLSHLLVMMWRKVVCALENCIQLNKVFIVIFLSCTCHGEKSHRQFFEKKKIFIQSHKDIETRTGSMLGRKQNKRYKTYYNVTMRYIQASAFWTLIFRSHIIESTGIRLVIVVHICRYFTDYYY